MRFHFDDFLPPRNGPVILRLLISSIAPIVLALAAAISCYFAGGVSLGLFFGPVLLITFLAPPLVMSQETAAGRLVVCAALILATIGVWSLTANLSLFDLARCGLVLAAYVIALAGAAALLERFGIDPVFAAAAIVLIGIAWLTWPIWLVPWLTGPNAQAIVQRLTLAHPLMAINGVLFERFNFWDRFTITYQQLTTLNQDIFYTLPKSVAWMVLSHLGVVATGAGIADILQPHHVIPNRRNQ